MEFRTKLVIKRKNKKAWLAYAGLVITASSLLLVFIPSLSDYIAHVFGTGIVIVVIGAVIARGDVATYGLSEEVLEVSIRGIRLGQQLYPLQRISAIEFDVQAYEGLYVNDGAMISGSNSDGMTNGLTFEADGKKHNVGFFLENKLHVQQLGLVFNEFYEHHIPFVERNRHTRTYLFQNLSPQELVAFRQRYGYH